MDVTPQWTATRAGTEERTKGSATSESFPEVSSLVQPCARGTLSSGSPRLQLLRMETKRLSSSGCPCNCVASQHLATGAIHPVSLVKTRKAFPVVMSSRASLRSVDRLVECCFCWFQVGLVYMFNLIVGTGALTMPKAFATAGWLVSLILLVFVGFMR